MEGIFLDFQCVFLGSLNCMEPNGTLWKGSWLGNLDSNQD
jgi:hypothetical protein